MPTQVIKRDGSKERFDPKKLRKSIRLACEDAGIETKKRNKIVKEVSAKVLSELGSVQEVATVDIKQKILAELDKVEPSAAEAWRKYDREQKGIA